MHIAEALRRLKLFPEAMEYFGKVLNLDSELWFAHLGRSLTKYNLGLREEAKADLEAAGRKPAQHPLVKFYYKVLGIYLQK